MVRGVLNNSCKRLKNKQPLPSKKEHPLDLAPNILCARQLKLDFLDDWLDGRARRVLFRKRDAV